ncbi:MAG: nucleotidyl transferase AbiEii/AbiGii toxin family protein [Candidatus Nanohaloarchaea archaeon]
MVERGFRAYERLGINAEFERSEKFEDSYSYTANSGLKALFTVEKDVRGIRSRSTPGGRTGTILETDVKQVTSSYPDIPSYFLTTMQVEEILPEKVAALSQGSRGRDLFDIWFLIDQTEVRKDILDQKLFGGIELEFPNEEEYNRDLRDLVALPPP